MYMVISFWDAKPGKEAEFEAISPKVRDALKNVPGSEFMEGIKIGHGKYCAVHGYTDEETYNKIVNDPNGPFAHALKEHKLEEVGEWKSSVRGSTMPKC